MQVTGGTIVDGHARVWLSRRLAIAALGVFTVLGAGACGGNDLTELADGQRAGSAVEGDGGAGLRELIVRFFGGAEGDGECINDVVAKLSEDDRDSLSDFYQLRSEDLSPAAQDAFDDLDRCFGASYNTVGGSPDGTADFSDDEVIDGVLEHVSAFRITDNIDKNCVRDYVRNHSNWPDVSSFHPSAQLNVITLDLALAVNERC